MKTPPFLLFAALVFWGWQSDLLWYGVALAGLLEMSRLIKWRWELEDVDFNRIFSLCVLLVAGLAAYMFTTSEEGGGWSALLHGGANGLRRAQATSAAMISVFRWLPLIFAPFAAAQIYNLRPSVPLTAVSMVLRIRRRRGEGSLAGGYLDISYAYFMFCLFSAGIHPYRATYSYFCGLVVLVLWALRAQRSRRFGWVIWLVGLVAVVGVGFLGQFGISRLEQLIQSLDAGLMARLLRSHTDASMSTTSIGQIGLLKLSPRIVVRLEPERPGMVPNYLREASYRSYSPHNETWYAGVAGNGFVPLQSEADQESWVLLPHKSGNSAVKIACYLNSREGEDHAGVLPLPSGVSQLQHLPMGTVTEVRTNRNGVVQATGAGLLIFDARYGPGATIDSVPDSETVPFNSHPGSGTNQFDLNVPTNELPALRQVIGEMGLTNAMTDEEKRLAVQTFLARNFTYSLWQGRDKQSSAKASPLTKFLLTSRSGHCEYFATATVLLLRTLGIPARYAVGYEVHEVSGTGYVVRERDAHAWCLVWNRQSHVWEDLDTTPGSWVAAEARNASFLDPLSDVQSWLVFQFEKLRWRESNLRQYLLWSITPVIVVLLYFILFKRGGRLRAVAPRGETVSVVWPGLDSVFYRLEKALAARGLPRQPSEALADWLDRALAEPVLASLRLPLGELLFVHYRYRFDPHGLNEEEKRAFVQNAEMVMGQLAKAGVDLGESDLQPQ